jgi:hypothetical protein
VDEVLAGRGVLEVLDVTATQRLPLHDVAMHGHVLSVSDRSLVRLVGLRRLVLELHIVEHRGVSHILRVGVDLVHSHSGLVDILVVRDVGSAALLSKNFIQQGSLLLLVLRGALRAAPDHGQCIHRLLVVGFRLHAHLAFPFLHSGTTVLLALKELVLRVLLLAETGMLSDHEFAISRSLTLSLCNVYRWRNKVFVI